MNLSQAEILWLYYGCINGIKKAKEENCDKNILISV